MRLYLIIGLVIFGASNVNAKLSAEEGVRSLKSSEKSVQDGIRVLQNGETKAMTFHGGGFKSITSFTGVMTGLLTRAKKRSNVNLKDDSLVASGLMDSVDIISAASGGNWFIAQLIYSKDFRELVESMSALDDSSAGDLFYETWTKKVKNKGSWRMWSDYNKKLLKSGGVDENVKLGDEPQQWAKGKVFLSNHAIVTPRAEEKKEIFFAKGVEAVFSYWTIKQSGTKDNSRDAAYIPATYSVLLGAGKEASAPHNYISSAFQGGLGLKYKVWNLVCLGWRCSRQNVVESTKNIFESPKGSFGNLPVYAATDSSSAAAGSTLEEAQVFHYASSYSSLGNTPENNYHNAYNFMNNLVETRKNSIDNANKAADIGLHELIDADVTDPSGIAHAIGAGATDIFAFMNSKGNNNKALYALFSDGECKNCKMGGEAPCCIFTENPENIMDQIKGWKSLTRPRSTFLKDLRIGTITATTKENIFYDIPKDLKVKLNLILIDNRVTIVEQLTLTNVPYGYKQYNLGMEEVKACIEHEDNNEEVEKVLSSLMDEIQLSSETDLNVSEDAVYPKEEFDMLVTYSYSALKKLELLASDLNIAVSP